MKEIEYRPPQTPEKQTKIDHLIPTSEKRQQIDNLISAEAVYGKDANPLFDKVGELEGIEVAEARDYQKDNQFKCAWFVFKDEDWWTSEDDLGLEFWDNTEKFLENKGYKKVEQPQFGDVVVYRLKGDLESPSTVKHLGVFKQQGKVVSKFNQGHVFEHDIDMVPNMFGESVVAMRKS